MAEASQENWVPDGKLRQHLLITSTHDLTIFGETLEAPAGAEYRILSTEGTIVQIEVRTADGDIVTGYTSINKIIPQHKKPWWKR